MDEFQTIAKLWPSDSELDLGTDSNLLGGPATFTRDAAEYVTSSDGANTYRFLFWNTGRHLTTKRRVRWNFSVLGWGTWTATRWYGQGGNGGPPRVRADAFSIGDNAPLSGGTPIDGAASTYAAGAWPFNGDDHEIGTAGGPATVVAKDPFSNYEFAGWLQLILGGDPSGEFVESDAGSGGTIGGTGFYDHVVGTSFSAAQNTSADLLATYGTHDDGTILRLLEWWREIILAHGPDKIFTNVDPSPEDLIRLKVLGQLMEKAQPARVAAADFQSLITAAPKMSPAELRSAMKSVETSLKLGRTALSAIESQLKRTKK